MVMAATGSSSSSSPFSLAVKGRKLASSITPSRLFWDMIGQATTRLGDASPRPDEMRM